MTQSQIAPSRESGRPYLVSDPVDVEVAAQALAGDGVIAHAFANFYVISTRPDERIVRRVNLMKGRPADQVGSVMTTPEHIPGLFDWSRLPDGLTRGTVLDLMDTLYRMGPFGFRGPAAAKMPAHLTYPNEGICTTQVIAPGYRCLSNAYFARSLELIRAEFLYGTSANRSRHLTGADDEPAHYRADGLQAEFGQEPDFFVLRHADEAAARRSYPLHVPQSTTILAFHTLAGTDERGCRTLILERHGSLHVDAVREIVNRFGFGLTLGPKARVRLAVREYADDGRAEVAA